MKRRSQLASFGAVLLLASCSGSPPEQTTTPPSPTTNSAQPNQLSNFAKPIVKSNGTMPTVAVPGLLQPTSAKVRVPSIVTGRTDPFSQVMTASLPMPRVQRVATTTGAGSRVPGLPPLKRSPTSPLFPRSVPAQPMSRPNLTPLPTVPVATAPLPPPNLTVPPAINIPIAPPSLTALAEAIEVTGAVQVQNQWLVIVKEPDSTSRYVKAGDSLANGQVLVKRVIAGPGTDPVVVLQQNGKEVMKTMGMAKPTIASAQ